MPIATTTLRRIFGEMCFVIGDGVIGSPDAELSGKALARIALPDANRSTVGIIDKIYYR